MVYYNEIDTNAAKWLRELITDGQIANGLVDERSIEDVEAADLVGFKQCHFFAGIGVWSYALRSAGWPDDRPVWTGSCPCQPFSNAGNRKGAADERHLWPIFHRLITQCKPPIVFGEQVASKAGRHWFNNVRLDLEALGYGVGGADLCAAGIGAPHIRQRLYFIGLADTEQQGREGRISRWEDSQRGGFNGYLGRGSTTRGVADSDTDGCRWEPQARLHERWDGEVSKQSSEGDANGASRHNTSGRGESGGLGNAKCHGDVRERGDGAGAERTAGSGREADAWAYEAGNSGVSGGVADSEHNGSHRPEGAATIADRDESNQRVPLRDCPSGGVAVSDSLECGEIGICGLQEVRSSEGTGQAAESAGGGCDCGLADTAVQRRQHEPTFAREHGEVAGKTEPRVGTGGGGNPYWSSPTNGFWRDPDWLLCRDGRWRAVEPGTFPLAHGAAARVGRLRGYGNAICAPLATAFIQSCIEKPLYLAGRG